MAWRWSDLLFLRPWKEIGTPRAEIEAAAEDEGAGAGAGAFVNLASLVTFGGATAVIIGIAKAVEVAAHIPEKHHMLVTAIVSLVVGIALFIINVVDEKNRPPKGKEALWFVLVLIALANTCFLFLAALKIPA